MERERDNVAEVNVQAWVMAGRGDLPFCSAVRAPWKLSELEFLCLKAETHRPYLPGWLWGSKELTCHKAVS